MVDEWIVWTLIFMGLLTLTAFALFATVVVHLLQARRDANPATQIHKVGRQLMDSPDRDHRLAGIDLIRQAHALDSDACKCSRHPIDQDV